MYSEDMESSQSSDDIFKQSFKRYKSRKNRIDFSEVVDFKLFHHQYQYQHSTTYEGIDLSVIYSSVKHLTIEQAPQDTITELQDFGLKPALEWQVYTIDQVPGLIFILDPFRDSGAKKYWIEKCLTQYPRRPNITNLDAHSHGTSNLWTEFVNSMECGTGLNRTELFKLRWVTLGYQYDWDTKLYYKDRYSDFPKDLGNLSKYIAQCLGYSHYSAEAGIVNYYHLDSTLAGHTDHSEYDMDSPLFSISFGCDAIFLIGGKTKNIRPVPICLRSGDIVVMAGESRLAYHAVPKILAPSKSDINATNNEGSGSIEKWISEYMEQSRININIRQVLKEGQQFPDIG